LATQRPASLGAGAARQDYAAGHFGVGRGGGAHAPDEWLLIDSSDPKVAGYEQQAVMFAELYEVARMAKSGR
jgi:acetylornithine deacetylase/succinyl-diaminopimelate desuccinylase-like protein